MSTKAEREAAAAAKAAAEAESEFDSTAGLPEGFEFPAYIPPGMAAAKEAVVKAEKELEMAKEAVAKLEAMEIGDVVAESAAKRMEAANDSEEVEQIQEAEAIRLSTEAKVQTNDPDIDAQYNLDAVEDVVVEPADEPDSDPDA